MPPNKRIGLNFQQSSHGISRYIAEQLHIVQCAPVARNLEELETDSKTPLKVSNEQTPRKNNLLHTQKHICCTVSLVGKRPRRLPELVTTSLLSHLDCNIGRTWHKCKMIMQQQIRNYNPLVL